jgi:hypothetical protein
VGRPESPHRPQVISARDLPDTTRRLAASRHRAAPLMLASIPGFQPGQVRQHPAPVMGQQPVRGQRPRQPASQPRRVGQHPQQRRRAALTSGEYASPLAKRVYDLRHACVSTWLNGGVAPAQVAEWAGHSVAVLLKVYAKCIDGQDRAAKRQIEEALRDLGEPEEDRPKDPTEDG